MNTGMKEDLGAKEFSLELSVWRVVLMGKDLGGWSGRDTKREYLDIMVLVQMDTEAMGLGVIPWRMKSPRCVTQSVGVTRQGEPVGCDRRPIFLKYS